MGSGVGGEKMQGYLHDDGSIVQVDNKIQLNTTLQARIATSYAAAQEDINWIETTGPATVTVAVGDDFFVNVTSGAVTYNLPAVHNLGDRVKFKMVTTAANTVTIEPFGAQTVDGQPNLVLSVDYEWAILVSNGTNWFQIS